MHRRTPCVGICSTTYGDLVCRGCKRFAHEVVGWNGFDPAQRDAVWARLGELLEGAVQDHVRVTDSDLLWAGAKQLQVSGLETLSEVQVAYEVLLRSRVGADALVRVGLQAREREPRSARELVREIDREFFARSRAHYERNFRIAAT